MSIIPSTACCCENPALFDCQARQVCLPLTEGQTWWDQVRAEYITVGRPKGPTVFPGTYWAAWHNGINPNGKLDLNMTIEVTKRTVVQEECGGTAPAVTVPTGADCTVANFLTATAGVKQTAYTDNFYWTLQGQLYLVGVVPDTEQEWAIGTDEYHLQYFPFIEDPSVPGGSRPYPAIPAGYFPCGIQGTCAEECDDENEATEFGTDPNWWPGENRKLTPRFFSKSVTVETTPVPASSYSQLAACDEVEYEDRCNPINVLDEIQSPVCLDFPMIVLPGHSGDLCTGQASASCDQLNKELGANQALWGFDLLEPELLARFEALNLPDGTYIGASNDIWMVKWTNALNITKIRFLFDVSRQITAAGQTLKFTTDVVLAEAGTVTKVAALESWRVSIDFEFTPVEWCLHAPECGCVQSLAENAPSVLTYTFDIPLDENCGGGGALQLSMSVGLENVTVPSFWNAVNEHGYCPCGTACECDPESPYAPIPECWQWDELPDGGNCVAGFVEGYIKFLGDEPIERGHPLWRRYRTRYNHVATTNNWCDPDEGYGPPSSPGMYGVAPTAGQIFVAEYPVIPPGSCCGGLTMYAGKAANTLPGECGSSDAQYDPTCNGGEGGFVCLPEGCYDVEPTDPVDGGLSYSIQLAGQCNPNHACFCEEDRCFWQAFRFNGGPNYNNCEIAGLTHVIGLPEIVIVTWDATSFCTPTAGEVFTSSEATFCEGKSSWLSSSIQATIT